MIVYLDVVCDVATLKLDVIKFVCDVILKTARTRGQNERFTTDFSNWNSDSTGKEKCSYLP